MLRPKDRELVEAQIRELIGSARACATKIVESESGIDSIACAQACLSHLTQACALKEMLDELKE